MTLWHQVIITSPNMCLEHDGFWKLLSDPKFATHISTFIIDEVHCISQWGDKFRPVYSELGTLHSFVPANIHFLVTLATLPPCTLHSPTDSIWTPHGLHKSTWTPSRKDFNLQFYLKSIWTPPGLHLESTWNPSGLQMELIHGLCLV